MYKNACFVAVLLYSAISLGQSMGQKVEQLGEVILIDSKTELKREQSGKVVTQIDSLELERKSGQSLAQIINQVSGIEINGANSVDGQNLGYYVRGGRNRQVVIMVDGVQLNDPSSISNDFDLRLLPLDQVSKIEIIKGASSTLYGSGAAAAVINITTKSPVNEKIHLHAQSILGSNQSQEDQHYDIASYDNNVMLSGKISKFDYQLNYNNKFSENISAINTLEDSNSEEDTFLKDNVYARLGYKINEKLRFYFYANWDQFTSEYDDSFMYLDADNVLKSKQFRTGSHWIATYKNGSFIFRDSYSELEREVESDYPARYDGKSYTFDAHNKLLIKDKFHTVVGVNGNFSSYNSYAINFGETVFSQTINDDIADFNIVDPYVNVVFTSDSGFNLNTGARLNIHSAYGNHFVYNINPSFAYKLNDAYIKALASYGTAYITPSLYQLYDPTYGTADLEPEEDRTIEGGMEFNNQNLRLSAVYFNRRAKNFVDFVTIDPVNFVSVYRNVAEDFVASGVEVEFNYNLNTNLDFSANYTFTETDEKFAQRIPKHKANSSISYQFLPQSSFSLSYTFTGERTDVYFDNETFEQLTVNLDSYSLLDFFINHRLNKQLKLFAGITNITNANFEEVYRFNTKGRNARFGISLDF